MLTTATIALAAYGLYSVAASLVDLVGAGSLAILIDLLQALFGILLLLAAALVRVLVPGGLALAIGSMLGLQALAIYAAVYLDGGITLLPHLARAGYATIAVLLAVAGARGGQPQGGLEPPAQPPAPTPTRRAPP